MQIVLTMGQLTVAIKEARLILDLVTKQQRSSFAMNEKRDL